MEAITISDFRRHMKSYFEKVFKNRSPIFISRPKGQDMVLMSKSDYDSMEETFYLLRSPKNAERLLKAVEADKADAAEVKKLDL